MPDMPSSINVNNRGHSIKSGQKSHFWSELPHDTWVYSLQFLPAQELVQRIRRVDSQWNNRAAEALITRKDTDAITQQRIWLEGFVKNWQHLSQAGCRHIEALLNQFGEQLQENAKEDSDLFLALVAIKLRLHYQLTHNELQLAILMLNSQDTRGKALNALWPYLSDAKQLMSQMVKAIHQGIQNNNVSAIQQNIAYLGEIKQDKAAKHLTQLLKWQPYTSPYNTLIPAIKGYSCRALGAHKDPKTLPALKACLEGRIDHFNTLNEAFYALARIGTEDALWMIEPYVLQARHRLPRLTALKAITDIVHDSVVTKPMLKHILQNSDDYYILLRCVQALQPMESTSELLTILHNRYQANVGNQSLQTALAILATSLGSCDYQHFMQSQLQRQDVSWDLKREIGTALIQLGQSDAFNDIVMVVLQDSKDLAATNEEMKDKESFRFKVYQYLAEMEHPQAKQGIQTLLNSFDEAYAIEFCHFLAKYDRQYYSKLLRNYAQSGKYADSRSQACQALKQFNDEATNKALVTIMNQINEEVTVRRMAQRVWSNHVGEQALATMKAQLGEEGREQGPDVMHACDCLGEIGHVEAAHALMEVLKNNAIWFHREHAGAILQSLMVSFDAHTNQQFAKPLIQCLHNETVPNNRILLSQCLGSIDNTDVIDTLLRQLNREPDERVRSTICNHLGSLLHNHSVANQRQNEIMQALSTRVLNDSAWIVQLLALDIILSLNSASAQQTLTHLVRDLVQQLPEQSSALTGQQQSFHQVFFERVLIKACQTQDSQLINALHDYKCAFAKPNTNYTRPLELTRLTGLDYDASTECFDQSARHHQCCSIL